MITKELVSKYRHIFNTDYTQDANCQGAFLMEGATTETDVSGNGNDLSVSAGDTIPQTTDKKFGTYARDFENTDSEVLYHGDGLSTDISGANQAIAIVCWAKSENAVENASGFSMLVTKYNTVDAGGRQYMLWTQNQVPKFTLSPDGSASTTAAGVTDVLDQTYHHIAASYNDTDIRVYVDGVLDSNGSENPKTYSSGINAGTSYFAIGGRASSTATPRYTDDLWDGLIDEVGVFDRSLDSTEINEIKDYGLQGGVAPSGWTGKVSGVTNPAKVSGVSKDNISKVSGVSSSS